MKDDVYSFELAPVVKVQGPELQIASPTVQPAPPGMRQSACVAVNLQVRRSLDYGEDGETARAACGQIRYSETNPLSISRRIASEREGLGSG